MMNTTNSYLRTDDDKIINERFERCLVLYLSARLIKKKLNMNPDALIPNLPKP